MNKGDTIQLKIPQQGRRFKGKLTKIDGDDYISTLSNGLYAKFPVDMWELATEEIIETEKEDCENTTK